MDTSKYYNRLLEVNAAERWARVEPGLVLDELNAALRPHGLRFAPDISTASRATVGGMMANNSAGARSVIYGTTIDHVLEQHVVLSDGSLAHFRPLAGEALEAACLGSSIEAACCREVRKIAEECAAEVARRFPKLLRRVGGYNLDRFVDPDRPLDMTKLIVGSDGTLAVVLEAKIRLVPLPKAKAVLVLQFADLLQALEATPAILEHNPSAVEVMDRFVLDKTKDNPALEPRRRAFLDEDPGALLCVEFYADHRNDLLPRMEALERDLAARGYGCHSRHLLDPAVQAQLWGLREISLGLSMSMKDDAKSLSFVEDTAVVNLKTEEGVRRFEVIASDVADLVLEFGGALSGEHGDGLVRSPFMSRMFGPVLYEAFRRIKHTFDPTGILNPGKIVDAPPLTANLRYGAGYQTPHPATFFDYSDYGGMAGAVEMCSGLGVCRKTLDGTMCPSYMATREGPLRPAAESMSCGSPWPGDSASLVWATTASGRSSTSVSNAGRARPSAQLASTWRASRASFWPTTTHATARRFGLVCLDTFTRSPAGAAALRRSRTG